MALAMGLEMATARIGSALALIFAPLIAESMGSVSKPIMFGLILLCIGFITFFIYIFMDKRLDVSDGITKDNKPASEFRIKSIGHILSNKAWWYIAIMCVLFYSAVFPFLKYASDLMVNKFNIDPSIAGIIPGILPFGTILLTPVFGNIYDRIGKGVTIMIIGSFLITLVHLIFSIPGLHSVAIAVILVVLLGIGFSLVPSAMWPSVAKIIPESELGTAYALIFWIQNWGLMGVPMLIGWVLDKYCISGQIMRDGKLVNTYDYTLPMIIFAGLSAISILFAFLLLAENKRKNFSLQLPNIEEKIKEKQEEN
jgi:nitrate/nitrite transporter NarK